MGTPGRDLLPAVTAELCNDAEFPPKGSSTPTKAICPERACRIFLARVRRWWSNQYLMFFSESGGSSLPRAGRRAGPASPGPKRTARRQRCRSMCSASAVRCSLFGVSFFWKYSSRWAASSLENRFTWRVSSRGNSSAAAAASGGRPRGPSIPSPSPRAPTRPSTRWLSTRKSGAPPTFFSGPLIEQTDQAACAPCSSPSPLNPGPSLGADWITCQITRA